MQHNDCTPFPELGVLYRMSEDDGVDEAYEADMRELRKEQLRADISPEEAEEEMRLRDEEFEMYGDGGDD